MMVRGEKGGEEGALHPLSLSLLLPCRPQVLGHRPQTGRVGRGGGGQGGDGGVGVLLGGEGRVGRERGAAGGSFFSFSFFFVAAAAQAFQDGVTSRPRVRPRCSPSWRALHGGYLSQHTYLPPPAAVSRPGLPTPTPAQDADRGRPQLC